MGVSIYQLVFNKTPFEGDNVDDYWENAIAKEI
jgi:hypothetical protein